MKQSKFQFSNPTIDSIRFNKNDSIDKKPHKFSYNIDNKVTVKRSQTTNTAKVILNLTIAGADDCPVCMNIEMSANFRWDDDTDMIDILLKQNAPALLLSYTRPIVTLIMTQAGFPNFNLPFADFTQPDE